MQQICFIRVSWSGSRFQTCQTRQTRFVLGKFPIVETGIPAIRRPPREQPFGIPSSVFLQSLDILAFIPDFEGRAVFGRREVCL